MKNSILLFLCLFSSFFINAQVINSTLEVNNPNCSSYRFSFVDNTPNSKYSPAYYRDPVTLNYPETGWSYFWYTNDGQTSCEQNPIFSFFSTNVKVYIVLTPRKKPPLDKKETFSQNFNVVVGINCPIVFNTNTAPWTDLNPRTNDTMYLVIPLKKCNNNAVFNGRVTGIIGMNYKGYLSFNDLQVAQNGSDLDINLNWVHPAQSQVEIVLKFLVTAGDGQDVSCEIISNSKDSGACNTGLSYAEIAREGPYDPNFLVPSLGRNIDHCNIGGDTIYYDLQFQNEGNGPTTNIYALFKFDTRLDPSTFFEINTRTNDIPDFLSQPYHATAINTLPSNILSRSNFMLSSSGQECAIRCDNMVLSPKSQNYYGSIGYIRCGIVVRPGVVLKPCDKLISLSEVIFDPMPAVVTNEAITSCECDKPEETIICSGKEDCCCRKCKPNYWREIAIGLLAFIAAFALFWFKFRKK